MNSILKCAATDTCLNKCSVLYLRKILHAMKKNVVKTTKRAAKGISKYDTSRQKRCWAVVVEALQEYIPKTETIDWKTADTETLRKYFPLNEKSEFEVVIPPKYVVSKGRSIKPTLLKMKSIDVIDDVDEHGALHTYPLFYSVIDYKNGQYGVGITPRSLCWLLDFTKEVGYVSFCVQSFLRLTRAQAMMTYLYISSNLKRGKWVAKIEDVRKWVGAPAHLDSWGFIYRYFDLAIQEFEQAGTRLRFSYKKITGASPARGGTPMIEKIEFTVIDRGAPDPIDIDPDDDCYEEEEETPVQSEKDRWEEWDKIVEERRKKYERHSA